MVAQDSQIAANFDVKGNQMTWDMSLLAWLSSFGEEHQFLLNNNYKTFLPTKNHDSNRAVTNGLELLALLYSRKNDKTERFVHKKGLRFFVHVKVYGRGYGEARFSSQYDIPVSDARLVDQLLIQRWIAGTSHFGSTNANELGLTDSGKSELARRLRRTS
jgi:hypothetical protein